MIKGTLFVVTATLGLVGAAYAMLFAADPARLASYLPPAFLTPSVRCGDVPGWLSPIVNDIEEDWYPRHWLAADEPSIFQASRRPDAHNLKTYRFTWLRTFHKPVIVRIDELPTGEMRLTAKQLSGAGGYGPGNIEKQLERKLTTQERTRLRDALTSTHVLGLPPTSCDSGADGARWIIEADDHGAYRYVNRWTPRVGPVHDMGLLFLSFTGWTFDRVY